MVISKLHIVVGFSIFLFSCNTYNEIIVKKEKGINFDNYKTFAWLPDREKGIEVDYNNDFIRQKTRNYVGHCMAQRALKIDTLNPQLLLNVDWLSHSKEVVLPSTPDVPNYFDITYYSAPTLLLFKDGLRQSAQESIYENEGSTVYYSHGGAKLTLIDRETNKIIWTGTVLGDLYDPNIMYRDLHPAIHKLMKRFPIKISKTKH